MIYGLSLSLLLGSLFSSCATNPPDVPICVEFTPERGRCVKIISGEKFDVNESLKFEEKTWWEHRPTMIQMPASSWAKMKAFIIKMCKKYGKCDKEISSWDRTIVTIDQQLEEKN